MDSMKKCDVVELTVLVMHACAHALRVAVRLCFVSPLCSSLLGPMQGLSRQQHFPCPCANNSYPHEIYIVYRILAAHASFANNSEILSDVSNIN